jgi:hypothetical protein
MGECFRARRSISDEILSKSGMEETLMVFGWNAEKNAAPIHFGIGAASVDKSGC